MQAAASHNSLPLLSKSLCRAACYAVITVTLQIGVECVLAVSMKQVTDNYSSRWRCVL